MELSFSERRVVGTLIEKGYTTPEQYPLTINSLVVGSNQKSCRSPVSGLDEEKVFLALDGLRKKGLAVLVQTQGSRTDRWKHRFGETLGVDDKETAVLAELFLRGPQTDGELRAHASRMVRLDSIDEVGAIIARLAGHDPPLIIRLSPEGRRRGVRYAHGLYAAAEIEELKRREEASAEPAGDDGEHGAPAATSSAGSSRGAPTSLSSDVQALQAAVISLEIRLSKIEEALGGSA